MKRIPTTHAAEQHVKRTVFQGGYMWVGGGGGGGGGGGEGSTCSTSCAFFSKQLRLDQD